MIKIYAKHIVFKETATTLFQHFRQLGYNCCLVSNIIKDDSDLYIIFGAHELVHDPPTNYIVYQLEQTPKSLKYHKNTIWTPFYLNILFKAKSVWDFSMTNVMYLRKTYNLPNIQYVRLGYSSCLEENTPELKLLKQNKDIDILFFGSESPRRNTLHKSLLNAFPNKNIIWKYNSVWFSERINLIARSKIIVNLHYDTKYGLLEIPRLMHILSQKQFVLSEKGRNDSINSKWESNIKFISNTNFSTNTELITACEYFLNSPNAEKERNEIALNGYKWVKTVTFGIPEHFIKDIKHEKILNKLPNRKRRKKKHPWYIPKPIQLTETKVSDNGSYTLLLPDIDDNNLPSVSIITPTRNRRHLFSLPLRNWLKTIYPKDKIEWIIIDDGEQSLKDLVNDDKRINYIHLDIPYALPIGKKRNLCVQFAKNDIIVCMDDDDYYFPEHVLSRVKTLLKYRNINVGCVGCSSMGAYDLTTGNSSFISNGLKYLTESTLTFTKSFWKERPFRDSDSSGEYFRFLQYRQNNIRRIPYQFVSVAFFHGNNMSGLSRKITESNGSYHTIDDVVDDETQYFISQLRQNINKRNQKEKTNRKKQIENI